MQANILHHSRGHGGVGSRHLSCLALREPAFRGGRGAGNKEERRGEGVMEIEVRRGRHESEY